jgi:hypothetical protein
MRPPAPRRNAGQARRGAPAGQHDLGRRAWRDGDVQAQQAAVHSAQWKPVSLKLETSSGAAPPLAVSTKCDWYRDSQNMRCPAPLRRMGGAAHVDQE